MDTVVADAVQERLGGGHRVLADHRVHHEQDLVRIGGVPDRRGLAHQLLVDAQPAGGVDDDDVVLAAAGFLDRVARHLNRVAHPVARLGGVDGHPGPLAHHLKLLDRVGALQVRGDQHRRVALLLKPEAQLARQRGLTGTLQARQHDHGRRDLREAQPAGLAAEDPDELLVDDLDDLLGRVERRGDLFRRRTLLDAGDELPHHGEGHVRLEQGNADLAGGRVNVGRRQPPPPAEGGEDLGQPVGECLEHASQAIRSWPPGLCLARLR
jgi:hypothetical protein